MHLYWRTERAASYLGEVVLRLLTAQAAPVYSALAVELKLYSREWCSWCIDAKDYLTDKGYQFEEIDVGQDRDAYEEMKELSEQTYVPTFVAGDKVLANFDTDQLEKFLREHQINP
jgi:glutaredoxin 3